MEATEPDPRWTAVLGWAAWGAVLHAEFDEAATLIELSRAAGQATGTRSPLSSQAVATYAMFRGDEASALQAAEEWVGLARAAGDEYELAEALVLLASALLLSDIERAVDTAEEATRLARDGGFRNVLSISLSTLGSLLVERDPERALVVLDEAMQVGSEIGDHSAVSNAIITRAWIAALAGDWPAALTAAREGLDRVIETGELIQQQGIRILVAIALADQGRHEPASRSQRGVARKRRTPSVGPGSLGGDGAIARRCFERDPPQGAPCARGRPRLRGATRVHGSRARQPAG